MDTTVTHRQFASMKKIDAKQLIEEAMETEEMEEDSALYTNMVRFAQIQKQLTATDVRTTSTDTSKRTRVEPMATVVDPRDVVVRYLDMFYGERKNVS
jgi:hypothetical protein